MYIYKPTTTALRYTCILYPLKVYSHEKIWNVFGNSCSTTSSVAFFLPSSKKMMNFQAIILIFVELRNWNVESGTILTTLSYLYAIFANTSCRKEVQACDSIEWKSVASGISSSMIIPQVLCSTSAYTLYAPLMCIQPVWTAGCNSHRIFIAGSWIHGIASVPGFYFHLYWKAGFSFSLFLYFFFFPLQALITSGTQTKTVV